MYVPKLRDVGLAVRIYYENIELSNAELRQLFVSRRGGELSSATLTNMKRAVLEEAAKRDMLMWERGCVNTKLAYEVWGLDIKDLENRWAKLRKLKEKEAV